MRRGELAAGKRDAFNLLFSSREGGTRVPAMRPKKPRHPRIFSETEKAKIARTRERKAGSRDLWNRVSLSLFPISVCIVSRNEHAAIYSKALKGEEGRELEGREAVACE